MMIDLRERRWINDDKNVKMNSDFFIGTTIQSLGDLKGYSVHIMFFGLSIPSRIIATWEDSIKLENEIWKEMQA